MYKFLHYSFLREFSLSWASCKVVIIYNINQNYIHLFLFICSLFTKVSVILSTDC
jgi:hypothetical protein